MEEENVNKKHKKHYSAKRGIIRIIALILAISMCFAVAASLIFMLIYA